MSKPVPASKVPGIPDHAHEETDVSIRGIGIFLAGLVVALAITAAVLLWLFRLFDARAAREGAPITALQTDPPRPPSPRLQSSPPADMRALRAEHEAKLSRYEWVDRDAGIVRIPLEQALERVAREGLPQWKASEDEAPASGPGHDEQPRPGQQGAEKEDPNRQDAPERNSAGQDSNPRPADGQETPAGKQPPEPPPESEPESRQFDGDGEPSSPAPQREAGQGADNER